MNTSILSNPSANAELQELNQQFLELFTNWLLGAMVLLGVGVLLLALVWGCDAMRKRHGRALVQERLRQIATASRSNPATHRVCQTFDIDPAGALNRCGHIWRFQVQHWTFALSVDQIEKPV
jgi:hypothetical protein